MRIAYVDKNFGVDAEAIISTANTICADYQRQGYDLTLRQLYYQFVARALIPNRQQSYKRLGAIISDARLAGRLDWNYITDRTRNVRGDLSGHEETPEDKDYTPIQVMTGQPCGWYSGDDGEICGHDMDVMLGRQ